MVLFSFKFKLSVRYLIGVWIVAWFDLNCKSIFGFVVKSEPST